MEYLMNPLTIVFIVVWIIEMYFFGMQRASLKISRTYDLEWYHLLPHWYKLTWLIRFLKYGLLVAIFIIMGWKWALSLLIISLILMVIIPIPYRVLYRNIFRKKVNKISNKYYNVELAVLLSSALDNAGF